MSADDERTSAEKLRELMAVRPTNPTPADVGRWWTVGGALVTQLLADLRDTAQGVLELSSIIGKRGRELEQLRVERDRIWPLWKQRYTIQRKLGYLLRDYPDDKETRELLEVIAASCAGVHPTEAS